ncbi:MAG: thermonuclease family protein [Candidatus Omnitrophica bacterium]|nr:thermonuclease family protein [Candidatus Omnitrophota bacterium]
MKTIKLLSCLLAAILGNTAISFAEAPESLIRNLNNSSTYNDVVVERVLSADTIMIKGDKKIRLIGVKGPDAPRRPKTEYDKNGLPIEKPVLPENTFEEKAYAFASHLLLGKHIRLEFDESRNDDDFTTVAYVFLVEEGTFANTEIIRYGYADLQIKPPNLKYEEELRAAYREAREEKRGMQSN